MLRILLAAPLLLVLVLFVISNTGTVDLRFWPFDVVFPMPLAGAVLGAAVIAFLLGALLAWGTGLRHRAQARKAQREVRRLEGEVAELRAKQATLVKNTSLATSTPQ